MAQPDIRKIAETTRTIAVVGLSPKPDRPSHGVARFLQSQGFRVIPVNPGHAGQQILGETTYARLADIPKDSGVDMVDIFRRSDAVPAIVEEAVACLPHLRTIWMQLGILHPEAAERGRRHGLTVIEDRCPKIEFPRYL